MAGTTSYTNKQLTKEETEKRSHSSGLGGLGNRGRSVLPQEHCISGRPRCVLRGAAQVRVCPRAAALTARAGPGWGADQRVAPGVPGRAGAHADGVGQAAGALCLTLRPACRPLHAPGRGHTPYVWASETVWGDSFIDGSSFGYTGETYHYYFLSESLAHGSRIS